MEGFYDECLDASSGVYRFFQDGAWKTSSSGKTVKIINPSTNQPVFSVQGARPLVCRGRRPGAPARPVSAVCSGTTCRWRREMRKCPAFILVGTDRPPPHAAAACSLHDSRGGCGVPVFQRSPEGEPGGCGLSEEHLARLPSVANMRQMRCCSSCRRRNRRQQQQQARAHDLGCHRVCKGTTSFASDV